jgi:hypothetical protein
MHLSASSFFDGGAGAGAVNVVFAAGVAKQEGDVLKMGQKIPQPTVGSSHRSPSCSSELLVRAKFL